MSLILVSSHVRDVCISIRAASVSWFVEMQWFSSNDCMAEIPLTACAESLSPTCICHKGADATQTREDSRIQ